MQVIFSHNYLDFDALASLYAAKKLFPQAWAVPSRSMERKVYEFYSLYKDFLKFQEKPPEKVEKVILVDNHWLNRLEKEFQKLLLQDEKPYIEIYDHHKSGDIKGDKEYIEEVGATTTLLVELIIKNNIPIDPIEATIFSLGIYQDTGGFTFSTTTPRDLKICAYLLERGANLNIINYYNRERLTDEQRALLNDLIQNAKEEDISGYKILLVSLEKDKYIEGLSILAHALLDEKNADALFILLKIKEKIYLMGRSRTIRINLLELLKEFNPGGHPTASTIVLTNKELAEIENYLRVKLKKFLPYNFLAKNIMSYPVETITPETTVSEAHKIMTRYGYGGLCVLENGKLVGIISRRDIEKAINMKLSKRKVKSFMSKPVITVDPDTPLSFVEQLLIEKDIGRVPVVKDDKVLGIITRQDILKFHFMKNHLPLPLGSTAILSENLLRNSFWWEILQNIKNISSQLNVSVYAVGGFVRDLLLQYPSMDLDIVIEGDVKPFLNSLLGKLKGKIRVYEQFGTAEIILENGNKIDIASARQEYYPAPGALPHVEKSSFWLDLKRRDFTINTLALSLNHDRWLEIIDLFGGLEDLSRKELRVLHNLSFIEDPSRILRGIRLEKRLGFTFEEKTFELLKNAIDQGFLKKLSKERIKEEILLILKEPEPEKIWKRLEELEALPFLLPRKNLPSNFEEINMEIRKEKKLDQINLQILNLLREIERDKAIAWLKDYHFSHKVIFLINNYFEFIDKELDRKTLDKIIDLPIELIFFLSLTFQNKEKSQLFLKIKELKEKKVPYLKGKDLINLGVKEGKIVGEILKNLFIGYLEGKLKNREDEISYVREIFKSLQ
ncbi:MAG: CBS domain-containing protein [Dictyoglomus sp.]|nr:CBS domain-containing protein [Dictyoglomus sp.]MCX7942005.1 CBS domain-containing protein [Dictyoglomaceae bacterium]MDW8188733.1 CBS domain-containing protein [Dictyoglomus sp.]